MAKKKDNKFKDSDADGLPDALEKKFGTNPYKADSDNDGLGDYEEINVYGTDPLDPDTDKDGMKDGEEIKRGRNPRGAGALKDLFISHSGNNYQPQALHPKRIVFYSLSAVLFKFILAGAVILLPVEAWLTPDILVEQSKKIISLTNEIRSGLNIAPLKENLSLDQAAYNKAEDMLLKQYFAHTGPDNRSLANWLDNINYHYAVAGENLAMGFSSPENVVDAWVKSPTHYKNMIDPDFTEIGVGISTGLYQNVDTTLAAQYFASPMANKTENTSVSQPASQILNQPVQTSVQIETEQTLGEKVEEISAIQETPEANEPIEKDVKAPEVDLTKSKIYIDKPVGQTTSIVHAAVYLSPDTKKARVEFNDYAIDLQPSDEQAGQWTGQALIFKQDQENISNPVVLASVIAEDGSGNKTVNDLKWENISPAGTTMLKQYFFIKQHQSPLVQPLFDITSAYYKIILLIALIALALNIFIQYKKQHSHIILSTLGMAGLLIALIIF